MRSKEGIIWCWKQDADNILYIFRVGGREIEVELKKVTYDFILKNNLMLTAEEKEFLINLKKEVYGKNR